MLSSFCCLPALILCTVCHFYIYTCSCHCLLPSVPSVSACLLTLPICLLLPSSGSGCLSPSASMECLPVGCLLPYAVLYMYTMLAYTPYTFCFFLHMLEVFLYAVMCLLEVELLLLMLAMSAYFCSMCLQNMGCSVPSSFCWRSFSSLPC